MSLRPRHIVMELDKFIVGQADAKKAVAIALRNRWRRTQVAFPLQAEITPKNILMIGPTGVGKTEIARRLAGLVNAPFIKVEATKFTEVGYVGRDVDSIIRDLVEVAVRDRRTVAMHEVKDKAARAAEERVLDLLLPTPANVEGATASVTRDRLREKLRAGEMDERQLEVEVAATPMQMEIVSPPGMEEMTSQLQGMFKNVLGGRRKSQRMKVREALAALAQEEAASLVNEEEIRLQAVKSVEQNGIVFLDEIDKVTSRSESQGAEVSRQGVQRDLLPLVEGTSVNSRYGPVNTDHILFIASGAFHFSKPSDLIPELQGRFPVRVELKPLTIEDFEHILTKTDACLVRQYQSLMATEGAELIFASEAVRCLAEMAHAVNEHTENIGARRLYAMMEKLLEDIAFEAGEDTTPKTIHIDADYVKQRLADAAANEDLARYIL